jgi:hypothetical protein
MSQIFTLHPDAKARMDMLCRHSESRQRVSDASRESALNENIGGWAEARRIERIDRESGNVATMAALAEVEIVLANLKHAESECHEQVD